MHVSVELQLGSPNIGSHKNVVVGLSARLVVSGNRIRVLINQSSKGGWEVEVYYANANSRIPG